MSVMQCKGCEDMVDTDKADFDFEHELCETCWLAMKAEEHKLKQDGMRYENT